MVRTQIQLTEDHLRRLKKLARREGVSVAEVIRRCVTRFLETEEPARAELYARAAGLIGAFKDMDGATDLSVHHDRYLDEALH
jgi:hypothetical protein